MIMPPSYDPFSVMHYPQCKGRGDWSLRLTTNDKNGVACIYGQAKGFVLDKATCQGIAPMETKTEIKTFKKQDIDKDSLKQYGPFPVMKGTKFQVKMLANDNTGDPDLYVRFDQPPNLLEYACRPYTSGGNETCDMDVNSDQKLAFVSVYGYDPGKYHLVVIHTP
jgi:serine protease